ncbi:MAG TPA: RsbRD N-terminal domain-containing protein [Anaeromyxobacteraceae bacterium]|nr:RsbRD N-terminal domain-containing protein [Anaeromyxobacteraceae bacterium]
MADAHPLTELIRAHHDQILASWEAGVRTLPSAANVPPKILFDELPAFLDWVAGRLESGDDGDATDAERDEFAIHHARGRLALGFDIVELVSELALLRDAVLELWESEPGDVSPSEVRRFDEELDHAVALCAVEFVRALPVQTRPETPQESRESDASDPESDEERRRRDALAAGI